MEGPTGTTESSSTTHGANGTTGTAEEKYIPAPIPIPRPNKKRRLT